VIATLDSLETQSLLDEADTSLDFVFRKDDLKPLHIERINHEFLLCYSDYSFFINRHGWRRLPEWHIDWLGNPTHFTVLGPYILSFDPSFIEIRRLDTSMLVSIRIEKNLRMLKSSRAEVSLGMQLEKCKLTQGYRYIMYMRMQMVRTLLLSYVFAICRHDCALVSNLSRYTRYIQMSACASLETFASESAS